MDIELGRTGGEPLDQLTTAIEDDDEDCGESSRLVEDNSLNKLEQNPSNEEDGKKTPFDELLEESLKNKKGCRKYSNKGDFSNLVTFCIMCAGVLLRRIFPGWGLAKYVLSFGLFGYAGGFTNWLAIKMLFDRIPFMYGSGVIPRQFKEIRETIKEAIMGTFFDQAYLERYLRERGAQLLAAADLATQVRRALERPAFEASLAAELERVAAAPEGELLRRIGPLFGGVRQLVPHIRPVVVALSGDLVQACAGDFDPATLVSFEAIRWEVDRLMTEKLELLTPEIVKALLEQVIREHLGWLVVWGNVFGACIGVVSQALGFGA